MVQTKVQTRLNLRMRHRILKAATTLFIRKGFSGVSLGDIAKKLQINQSLIYHYFPSKDLLWHAVKQPFFAVTHEERVEVFPLADIGLRRFLENYLSHELDFWFHHTSMARLLRWSSLEGNTSLPNNQSLPSELSGPDPLCTALEQLQKQGMIAKEFDLSVAAALLRSAVRGPFFCNSHATIRSAALREAYLQMIVVTLERMLEP